MYDILDINKRIEKCQKQKTKGEKMGFFDKLKKGMGKTKSSFNEKINNVFSNFRKVDEELLEELEEALIM